jgi:hypothetical protein
MNTVSKEETVYFDGEDSSLTGCNTADQRGGTYGLEEGLLP